LNKYGIFADVTGTALALAAAAGAISLAWTKRTKWQPPEEAVPNATARLASLGAMVALALIYAFGSTVLGFRGLAILAVAAFSIALLALACTIYLSITRSFLRANGKRTVGGFRLTEEAEQIRKTKQLTEQQLFSDAQGRHDLVWTSSSRAWAHIAMNFAFLGLILSGTIALSAAAALAFMVR
jgi:hypothetical protein